MPAALIEVRKQYNEEEVSKLIDAVHLAIAAASKIPLEDKTVRLIIHEAHKFEVSPERLKRTFIPLSVSMLLRDVQLRQRENYIRIWSII
jgi:hypothetical protein